MSRCLFCYKELFDNEIDFHKSCSKKIFGTTIAPELPYTRDNLTELAKQVIRSQTTLTGVQAKLSLDIKKGGHNETERFTIVGLWGRYILKPQTERFAHLPELEDLTMHLAEMANNKDILSRESIFQLFSAMFNSQPSGISPSKKGKRTFSLYGFSVNGKVKLIASALVE